MNMTLKKNRHRIGRTASAVAVAVALTLGAAPAAQADVRTVTGTVSTQAVADIDPARTINLTLIKNRPNPLDGFGPAPVEGVTFTVRKVEGVDLTTDEGWALARSLTVEQARERGLGEAHTAMTDAEGVARLYNLPVGLYLISESGQSPEFLLTLPTGSADGTAWDYAVTVQTKANGLVIIPIPVPIIPGPGSSYPGSSHPGTTPLPEQPGTPVPEQPTAPEPQQPGSPVPGKPTAPEPQQPEKTTTPGRLPVTGANVAWMVALALFLISGGALLMRRRSS